jgi:putative zinc finger protein
MTHFDVATCADFVRGVLGPNDRAALERHVAGCRSCAETVGWLRDVAAITAADDQYEPPADALRRARAVFAVERPRILRGLPGLLARLTFDSFAQPLAAAGVRGPSGLSRQAMFEAGDYAIDITLDQPPGSRRTMLVGQIVSRATRAAPITASPVLLTSGETLVARTVCDRYGEFLIEYDAQPRLELHVVVDGGKRRLEMSLDTRAGVRSHGASRGRKPKPVRVAGKRR